MKALGAVLVAALAIAAVPARPINDDPADSADVPLTVLVHDYAGLSETDDGNLQKLTSEMLYRAGIDVSWGRCSGPRVSDPAPECNSDLEHGRVMLRLLARCEERASKPGDLLGVAVVEAGYASLCEEGIARFATDKGVEVSIVRAYAAAHEIGHLLLGRAHSRSGLMRAVWRKQECQAMHQLWLQFDAQQAAALRNRLSTGKRITQLALERGADGPADGAARQSGWHSWPSLRVLVYNYAGAPAETIIRMEQRVSHLFAEANVGFDWSECYPSVDSACAEERSPRLLILRVLAGADNIVPNALGTSQGDGFASVYYERVRALATGKRTVSEALACVVAHEFGHLLLGRNAHSHFGMMHGAVRDADLDHGLPGVFRFSAAERQRIRVSVVKRLALISDESMNSTPGR